MQSTCKLLSTALLSSLLIQGCASYQPRPLPSPRRTVPPAATRPQTGDRQQPVPATTAVPPAATTITSDFSRQAAAQANQGKLDLAAATLERGLRVAPKDALLWSQLAEIKLQQGQYHQAGSLAAKSNSLAGANTGLKQKNHRISEQARQGAEGY